MHILAGLTCVIAGAIATLAKKRRGLHPTAGRIYLASYTIVFGTTTGIAFTHWEQDAYLFFIGVIGFTLAATGLAARRGYMHSSTPLHIAAMGGSYTALLTAFYVDNGPKLQLLQQLPTVSFWLLPSAVSIPLIVRVLTRYRSQQKKRHLWRTSRHNPS